MKAEIRIFSNIGHTPLTGRGKSYCDLLLYVEIDVQNVKEAREETERLIKETEHGHKGNYYCPDEPNQNIRNRWISR